jgi:hypothetical protein
MFTVGRNPSPRRRKTCVVAPGKTPNRPQNATGQLEEGPSYAAE